MLMTKQSLSLCLMSLMACSHPASLKIPDNFVAVEGSSMVTGWFSAGGEWALFDKGAFSGEEGANRCINVVNNTGKSRDYFSKFHGTAVTIRGMVVKYDSLPVGTGVAERALTRRYWKDQPVFNGCLSDNVVVATEIRAMR